ncbi:single-stranded DNA-binding protein [Nocardioides pyridinolyticus]
MNQVRLIGRLSQGPEERLLPSGDSVWTFRVVVPRRRSAGRSRQTVDAIECAAWSGRARRSVSGWAADDVVEVTGELHRRFFRAGGAVASRVEVEMTSGKVIRRAMSG